MAQPRSCECGDLVTVLVNPRLAEVVAFTAERLGWPRVQIELPGRLSSLPIAPYPESWRRTLSLFRQTPEVLLVIFGELAAWECHIRRATAIEADHA